MEIPALIEAVVARVEKEAGDVFTPRPYPPEPIGRGIPLLEKGEYRDATPQLQERFSSAGRVEDAWAGQAWLGLSDMEAAWSDPGILEQVRNRQDNWEGSAPAAVPWDRLTLFGVNREEFEETYLVWPESRSAEPEVWVYLSQAESRYPDLRTYLEHLTS
jgi:hypothetical protein